MQLIFTRINMCADIFNCVFSALLMHILSMYILSSRCQPNVLGLVNFEACVCVSRSVATWISMAKHVGAECGVCMLVPL